MGQIRFKHEKNGFTAVELVVGVALAAVIGSGALALNNFVSKTIMSTRDNQSAARAKRDIVNVLATANQWYNLISNANSPHPTVSGAVMNPDLACIKNGTACTAGTYPLTVFDSNNIFYTDPANHGLGFSASTSSCQTFSADGTSGPCPMRYETDWSPICPTSGACINPSVKVTLRLIKNTNEEVAVTHTNTTTTKTNVQETSITMVVPNPMAKPLTSAPPIVKNDQRPTIHDCGTNSHTVKINLDQDVYHSDDGEDRDDDYTITVPPTSTVGGTLTLTGGDNHKVVYTLPDASATGHTDDDFTFTVTKNDDHKSSTGHVYIALDSGTSCDHGDGSDDGKGDD